MNSKISLDTQEQLMNQAKAASKAKYDNALLAEQEEKIKKLRELIKLDDLKYFESGMINPLEDLDTPEEKAQASKENMDGYKPTLKEYNPDEAFTNKESNPIGRALGNEILLKQYPKYMENEAEAKASKTDTERRIEAAKQEFDLRNPKPSGMIPNGSYTIPIEEDYDNANRIKKGDPKQFKYNGIAGKSFTEDESREKDYPEPLTRGPKSLDLAGNAPTPKNEWKNMAWPEVNTALKAIADRDPELMQLPEIQALLKRGKAGYDKQLALTTVAPFTSNPELWMTQANSWREQGDKNLMDAANNLETLRNRQLEAAKSAASDLTAQKSNAVNMHGQVLNFENSLVQSATMLNQEAAALSLEAEKVHENGDVAMDKALTNARSFFERVGVDMGLSPEDAAMFNSMANKLTNTNLRQALDYIRPYESKVNAPMRSAFNTALNNIEAGIAEYDRAMNESAKLKSQADYKNKIADDRLYTASTLGGKYNIPEWMNADTLRQFNEIVNNGRGSNLTDTQDGNTSGVITNGNTKQGIITNTENIEANEDKQTKPNTPPPPPPPPPIIKFDPWSYDTFSLPSDRLAANIDNLATAYNKRGSKGAGTKLAFYIKSEGDNPESRKEIVVKGSEERMIALLDNLAKLSSENKAKYNAVMNRLNSTTLGAIQNASKGEPRFNTISTDAYNVQKGNKLGVRKVSNIDTGSALQQQAVAIQDLLRELGYV